MAFKQSIPGQKHCRRCHARAQLRVHDIENTNMVELRLDCPKCKLSKFVKLTTQKFLDLDKKEKKYLKLLHNATTGSQRNKILKRLEVIRRDKLVAEVQP